MESIIVKKILENIKEYPDHHALWIDDCCYTYQELFDCAASLANLFLGISNKNSHCAIFSDRNIFAYQSILALLFSGKAYVPLNPNFPMERNLRVMNEASYEMICVDVKEDLAVNFLEKLSPMIVCVFRKELYSHLVKTVTKHKYIHWKASDYEKIEMNAISVSQTDFAYLMFTSGSTGQPKGIAIKHSNLSQYVNSICELYKPSVNDRFSQLCELTFDLSVHEIFICWAAGAALYVVPDSYILGISKFIKKHAITHWTSVPSNITLLNQLKQLDSNSFPSLKVSFFCGEALLHTQAKQWKIVAPNSDIANLYGPTEATVTFTYFNWHPNLDRVGVPIGLPLPNQQCSLIDLHGQLVKEGEIGELCLAGNQVIESYWNNPLKSEKSFKKFPWDEADNLWYLTGDLARWDKDHGYIYHGRIDDQWQIRGYRVEKQEIENELKKLVMNDGIAIVPLDNQEGHIEGIAAFINEEINPDILLKLARESLPNPMVPKKIISLLSLPQNASGKIDYSLLKKMLQHHESFT